MELEARVIAVLQDQIAALKAENAALEGSHPCCCPPSGLPYLANSGLAVSEYHEKYTQQGTIVSTGDGGAALEFYEASPAGTFSSAVIVVPDVWGWNSGRTRAICDTLTNDGYLVVCPKLLQPPLEGGTDGDGLPPNFNIAERGQDFGPWAKQIPWIGKCDGQMDSLLQYLDSKGVQKIGMLGMCWGGWIVFHTSAISDKVVCGAIPHPSCQIEGMHGGDLMELTKSVKAPMLMMPADGDMETYLPDGDVVKTLQATNPKSRSMPFLDMKHGWVPRGDMSVEKTANDVKKAISAIQEWLKEFL